VSLIGKVKPYVLPSPATLEIEFTTRNTLSNEAEFRPGAEIVDSQTIRFKGKDVLEVWQRYRAR
jgi:D-aminopeptidase